MHSVRSRLSAIVAYWLRYGVFEREGAPTLVAEDYAEQALGGADAAGTTEARFGSGELQITRVRILDSDSGLPTTSERATTSRSTSSTSHAPPCRPRCSRSSSAATSGVVLAAPTTRDVGLVPPVAVRQRDGRDLPAATGAPTRPLRVDRRVFRLLDSQRVRPSIPRGPVRGRAGGPERGEGADQPAPGLEARLSPLGPGDRQPVSSPPVQWPLDVVLVGGCGHVGTSARHRLCQRRPAGLCLRRKPCRRRSGRRRPPAVLRAGR